MHVYCDISSVRLVEGSWVTLVLKITQSRRHEDVGFDPGLGISPRRGNDNINVLPGKSTDRGRWTTGGHKEWDIRLSTFACLVELYQ